MGTYEVTYADGHTKKVTAPTRKGALEHAENPAVNRKNLRDINEGGHGRATIGKRVKSHPGDSAEER
jgi:hypothetical protein